MSEIMHFRGILPPAGREFIPPPSQASPGGLILRVLHPLRGELAAALARGDQNGALRIAYTALSQVADALARLHGGALRPDQARIHLLLVQLTWLPLEVHADGTLSEAGTLVEVHYRDWVVPRAEAQTYADQLMARFQTLWPGAWVVVTD
ncbi:MAG: hypothetical protein N2439_11480 [Anaerolineae bacterium]|nr:hypothetical protein [Anaerolineae bacterium]